MADHILSRSSARTKLERLLESKLLRLSNVELLLSEVKWELRQNHEEHALSIIVAIVEELLAILPDERRELPC